MDNVQKNIKNYKTMAKAGVIIVEIVLIICVYTLKTENLLGFDFSQELNPETLQRVKEEAINSPDASQAIVMQMYYYMNRPIITLTAVVSTGFLMCDSVMLVGFIAKGNFSEVKIQNIVLCILAAICQILWALFVLIAVCDVPQSGKAIVTMLFFLLAAAGHVGEIALATLMK